MSGEHNRYRCQGKLRSSTDVAQRVDADCADYEAGDDIRLR